MQNSVISTSIICTKITIPRFSPQHFNLFLHQKLLPPFSLFSLFPFLYSTLPFSFFYFHDFVLSMLMIFWFVWGVLKSTGEVAGRSSYHTSLIPHTHVRQTLLSIPCCSILNLNRSVLDGHVTADSMGLHQHRLRMICLHINTFEREKQWKMDIRRHWGTTLVRHVKMYSNLRGSRKIMLSEIF